ncbi:MAG: cell division protein ZapA [Parvularculaceae bacterium]|nr:cell division protein ZapA [Parvularculaceae bacterium]
MAQVDILVNDRLFKVTCEDGQEQRLSSLAAHLDRHVQDLVRELGQIGDTRLLLLAALTVCDDLFEAKARIEEFQAGGEEMDQATVGGASRVIDAAAKRVDSMARRLEDVA